MDRQLWKFLQGLSALQVVKGHPPEAVGLPGFHKQTFSGKGVLDEELTFKKVDNVFPQKISRVSTKCDHDEASPEKSEELGDEKAGFFFFFLSK